MTYVPQWERLSEAAERVKAAARLSSKDEAQTYICRAIADGRVQLRGKLATHASKPITASDAVLERKDFHIPTEIKPEDLDWGNSRPLKSWSVRRGSFEPAGYWYLEWIKLFRPDVTDALCRGGNQGTVAQQASIELNAASQAPVEDRAASASAGLTARSQQAAPGPARPRGRRPAKFERAKDSMRRDIQQGQLTAATLREMPERVLSETYGVSRDTARKARNAVLSELGDN